MHAQTGVIPGQAAAKAIRQREHPTAAPALVAAGRRRYVTSGGLDGIVLFV